MHRNHDQGEGCALIASPLVLSLFPGIGLLDMAFEKEGFCVVRGPDLLWGGDIRQFHPPSQVFAGVIGGPPCPAWSALGAMARAAGKSTEADLIPEFERVIRESKPSWFLMENVPRAPLPHVAGFHIQHVILSDVACGGVQRRRRRFTFGCYDDWIGLFEPETFALEAEAEPTLTKKRTRWNKKNGRPEPTATQATWPDAIRQQGLPDTFLQDAPFTMEGKFTVLANGVPLPMGRQVAQAVRRALNGPLQPADMAR